MLSKLVICPRACTLGLLSCSLWVAIGVAQTRPAQNRSDPAITGSISGTVSNDAGNPVALISVVAHRRWSPSASSTPAQTIAVTDSKGKYAFSNLESGSYLVCVVPNDPAYVDPCAWSARPPAVNLNEGQSANLDITLAVAASVYAHVADPDKAVSAILQKTPAARAYLIGAWTPNGGFQPMSPYSSDSNGSHYRIAVPYDTDVAIAMHPGQLSFQDAKGAAFQPQDLKFTFHIKKGDLDPALNLTAKPSAKP